MQEYDYTIDYKSGKTHLELDMSCHPQPLNKGETERDNDAFIFTLKKDWG